MKKSEVNEYAENVVNDFITDITDHVFETVKHNEETMFEYVRMVDRFGKRSVNIAIGKKVKEILQLENAGRTKKRDKRIIKSYTRHKAN